MARKRRISGATEQDGGYLASVLHDLRQPLTALRLDLGGAIQLLRREDPAIAEALLALEDALEDTAEAQRIVDAVQGRVIPEHGLGAPPASANPDSAAR